MMAMGGKAFWYGQFSAAVEPVAGILGAGLVPASRTFRPYLTLKGRAIPGKRSLRA
jgi:zinc transporter ZupT